MAKPFTLLLLVIAMLAVPALGNQYVLVGRATSRCNLYTSTDGTNWTDQHTALSGCSVGLTAAAALGTTWVLTSSNSVSGALSVYTSTDFSTWNAHLDGLTGSHHYVCSGNNMFLDMMTDATDTAYATSTDGVSWTPYANSGTWTGYGQCAYLNHQFVVFDSTTFLNWTSTDLVNWTSHISSTGGSAYLGFDPTSGLYMSFPGTGTTNIYTSSNLDTWATVPTGYTGISLYFPVSNGTNWVIGIQPTSATTNLILESASSPLSFSTVGIGGTTYTFFLTFYCGYGPFFGSYSSAPFKLYNSASGISSWSLVKTGATGEYLSEIGCSTPTVIPFTRRRAFTTVTAPPHH